MLIADDMILTKYEYKSWYKKLYFISEFIVILCKFIIIVLSLGLVCFFIDKIFDHD